MFIELKSPSNPLSRLSQHIAPGVHYPQPPPRPRSSPRTFAPLRAVGDAPPPGCVYTWEWAALTAGAARGFRGRGARAGAWPAPPREWRSHRAGRLSSGRLGNASAPPLARGEGFGNLSQTIERAAVTPKTPRSPGALALTLTPRVLSCWSPGGHFLSRSVPAGVRPPACPVVAGSLLGATGDRQAQRRSECG